MLSTPNLDIISIDTRDNITFRKDGIHHCLNKHEFHKLLDNIGIEEKITLLENSIISALNDGTILDIDDSLKYSYMIYKIPNPFKDHLKSIYVNTLYSQNYHHKTRVRILKYACLNDKWEDATREDLLLITPLIDAEKLKSHIIFNKNRYCGFILNDGVFRIYDRQYESKIMSNSHIRGFIVSELPSETIIEILSKMGYRHYISRFNRKHLINTLYTVMRDLELII